MKSLLRSITPPFIIDAYRSLRAGGTRYEGPFRDWQEAAKQTGGYDRREILEAVRKAAGRVRDGQAAFERDSVAFAEPQPPFPLLAVLLQAAGRSEGTLSVLDFGGSLGSSYYRCRDFLAPASRLRWSIVEQPMVVECGRREFADERLKFFASIAECLAQESPTVALLSSSLPYVEDPYRVLGDLNAAGIAGIVLDRTPFHDGGGDLIFVQHVPAQVYRASYPCRVFGTGNLAGALSANYEMTATLEQNEGPFNAGATVIRYGGWAWTRRPGR